MKKFCPHQQSHQNCYIVKTHSHITNLKILNDNGMDRDTEWIGYKPWVHINPQGVCAGMTVGLVSQFALSLWMLMVGHCYINLNVAECLQAK